MNTTSNSSLRNQLWDKELMANVIDSMFFYNGDMVGEGENNIIRVKNDLKKEKGEKINMGLTYKMSGDGVTGDDELEGNEESITGYHDDVLIDQIRNGARLKGRLDEQKASYSTRKDAKEKGGIWIAEFIERQIFMKMGGVASTDLTDVNDDVYSGRAAWSNTGTAVPTADEAAGTGSRYICSDASGLDSLAATDIFTLALIDRAKAKAATSNPKIRPIKIKGKNYFVQFLHPWQVYDVRTKAGTDNINWNLIQREAQARGDDNPIFTGALGVYNGVILHEHEYVPTCQASSDFVAGATAAGARAFRAPFCGQDAVCLANAGDRGAGKVASVFMEAETFDYKNKAGFAVGFIGGVQKPTFNSLDYSVINIDTGATALS